MLMQKDWASLLRTGFRVLSCRIRVSRRARMVRAKNYEEAIDLPMKHEYGNGVAIYTRDGDAARD
ncbi:MAG: hypothetical protein ACO1NO_00170, partial [Burkholderiaceae bacterium]